MFINNNMVASAQNGDSGEFRGENARKLYEEVKSIIYEIKMQGIGYDASKIYGWERSTPEMKRLIRENTEGEWTWEQILEIIEIKLKTITEEEAILRMEAVRKEEIRIIKEDLRKEIAEELRRARYVKKNIGTKICFACNEKGHVARFCNKNNKNFTGYLKLKQSNINKNFNSIFKNKVRNRQNKFIEKKERHVLNDSSSQEIFFENEKNKNEHQFDKIKTDCLREELKQEFPKVFNTNCEIKYCPIEKCSIKTEPGKKIVKKGQIIPQALKMKTEEYLQDLKRRKVIRSSKSEWRNPIRAIEKPDGRIRLVSNFIALNSLVEKDPYELCNIRDVIRATNGSKWFSVIDLKEGFYHIEIEENDKYKTAFEFNGQIYEWNSMVMGFKNSPQILQRVMNNILREGRGKGVEVYMDDIVIHSSSISDHNRKLKWVLEQLNKNNMRVNIDKLQLCKQEIMLLGAKIDGKTRESDIIKRNEALEYPRPKNIEELRRFLGLSGWFRDYIENFSGLTENLTACLKGKIKKLEWTEKLEKDFVNVKEALKSMKKLLIPDYKKEFILKTDASNTGLGAVLLQKDQDGKIMPVQWSSKKLTPTETRYGISEKEMYAVFWGIKKFEYELRGRKFRLVTDHKALEEIRKKPAFNNNRINRWVEKIQEFDFDIEYNKGDTMVVPDALSRIYEDENSKSKSTEKGIQQKQGKWNKHVTVENNKNIWTFKDGRKAIVPDIKERKDIINDLHKKFCHRGIETIYHELKQKYYWPGVKETIKNIIKRCETCQINNRKSKGGCEFVVTTRPFEKFALDLIDLRQENKYIILGIDYFTRGLVSQVIQNKTAEEIINVVENWIESGIGIQEIITDNGKEFCNNKFKMMCYDRGIIHNIVGVESHRSNGRIERAIRTIRDGLCKELKGTLEERIKKITNSYNKAYHSAISNSPENAFDDKNGIVNIENSKIGKYAQRFKKRYREKFKIGERVRIAKNENIKSGVKEMKGRFVEIGKVLEKFNGDTYLIKKYSGKLVKKRHYDLKRIIE